MPYLMAGPCSAESEEQILHLAQGLAKRNCDLFRAGLWKPRTRPGSFEGVGAAGIEWLVNAREQTGISITTEVARSKHVELVVDAGFDAVWLGARTTANPFSVREIAEVLKGVSMPVIIKNPVNPDAGLWIGAIERIMQAGISDIMLIHRGFSAFNSKKYRNEPAWHIPAEVRAAFPQLPMLCDISHIAGVRPLLQEVAQAAFDLNYAGLMVEVHPDPPNALSDADQQITLEGLDRLLGSLVKRDVTQGNGTMPKVLHELRQKIDSLDAAILENIGMRMALSRQIGEIKEQFDLPILQPERWQRVLEQSKARAVGLGLSEHVAEAIFRAIHQESIEQQMDAMRVSSEAVND